jgi:hypothetical protein
MARRSATHIPTDTTLELFTLDEVAATFRVSPRTMREHVKRYPFYRLLGGRKLFTRSDIKALYEAMECPSSSSDAPGVHTGICTAPSEASLYAKAQELLTPKPRKRSGRSANGNSSTVVSLERRRRPRSSLRP